jgi:hypothetical protein
VGVDARQHKMRKAHGAVSRLGEGGAGGPAVVPRDEGSESRSRAMGGTVRLDGERITRK